MKPFTRREIATLMAALHYWELQGVMSDCAHAHKMTRRAGHPLVQHEREKLLDKLEQMEREEV